MLLFRPVGLYELRLIYDDEMCAFPPRLPDQPIFYPVLNQSYAEQIARDWNTKREPFAGYVTRFSIDDAYASQFETHKVGGAQHLELWVPAEQLPDFNAHIESEITVVAAFFGPRFEGEVPQQFMLAGRSASEQLRALSATLEYNGMDFICEVSANHRAVFLNFAYWLSCPLGRVGLSATQRAAVIAAIRESWGRRDAKAVLPGGGASAA